MATFLMYLSAIVDFPLVIEWTERARRFLASLICLVLSCIFVQMATALACRSAEMIFDFRYASMIVIQLSGFVGCIIFAYNVGATFAPIISQQNL